jgi:hypothetical protein
MERKMPAAIEYRNEENNLRRRAHQRRAGDRHARFPQPQPIGSAPTFAVLLPAMDQHQWRVVRAPGGQRLEAVAETASDEDIIKLILCIAMPLVAALASIPFMI